MHGGARKAAWASNSPNGDRTASRITHYRGHFRHRPFARRRLALSEEEVGMETREEPMAGTAGESSAPARAAYRVSVTKDTFVFAPVERSLKSGDCAPSTAFSTGLSIEPFYNVKRLQVEREDAAKQVAE